MVVFLHWGNILQGAPHTSGPFHFPAISATIASKAWLEAGGSPSGGAYRAIAFPGNPHGMALISPKVEPNTLQLMLDWLKLSLGL
jgi:hypothetical protein